MESLHFQFVRPVWAGVDTIVITVEGTSRIHKLHVLALLSLIELLLFHRVCAGLVNRGSCVDDVKTCRFGGQPRDGSLRGH
jgi:hypothetical protein